MPMSPDRNGELRAAFASRMLSQARETAHGGVPEMLVRIALATLFVALVVLSNELMGVTGLIFVGSLFVILVFFPVLIRVFRRSGQKDAVESGSAGEGVEPHAVGEEFEPDVARKAFVSKSASEA